ncbi:hypothetical protein H8356DRAFT_1686724 [Neocallimastix lanati (nom. inval.)]|uniref:Transmembrane protein n=1 Tax=Neocallimastix californiae TaxID=1754190 RepID=A0A1Y2FMJ4_9FUNG|nr:hypothetical protein H8356DRAFT_1686724 [Neocallimastix sp. JGI-2020a]ORY85201.1 hypothetical protein LY90DRAFT_697048 [Neocallimastix californiae]|eukprot:ORY85201.1 hypothetical protein LY90DRAFT_697048 [Neocallimastix californiae]
MSYMEIMKSSTGYIVFGIFSIIAIIFMVKYSIEIDEENFRQQAMENYKKYQTTSRNNSHASPQLNNNQRFSPQLNSSGPLDSANTSFSSQLQYNINPVPNNNVLIPPRKTNLQNPSSPNTVNNNINQYGNYMPTNNFRNSISYNRQSQQYLLQNNY